LFTATLTTNDKMHLIESYATNCGVKIHKPYIYEKFFPLDFENYITFSSSSCQAKDYDFWDDVICIVKNKLKDKDIEILQLGENGSRKPNHVFSALGSTNPNQDAYLIKNSLLHFGIDNYYSQLAGSYDKKLVCIYANNYKNDIKPYWGDNKNQILIESHRDGKKPSFAAQEMPKTINLIKPEEIAKAICDLLEIKFDYEFSTLDSGLNYINKIVDCIPNQVVNSASLGIQSLIVRMDFEFNEENLKDQLDDCVCSIVTNKPIDRDLILEKKQRIKEIIYLIEKDNDPSFVEFLQHNGVKFVLMTDLEEKEINPLKIDYMDSGIVHQRTVPDFSDFKKLKGLHFKSSKLTLSGKKMYLSKYHWKNDMPCNGHEDIQEAADHEDFWIESDYFMLLQKNN